MKFIINTIKPSYKNNSLEYAEVAFNAESEGGSVFASGNFQMSAEEYNQNATIEKLEDKAKDYVLSRINNPSSDEDNSDEE